MDKVYDLDAVDVQTSSEETEQERESARKNALSELASSIGVIPQNGLTSISAGMSNTSIVNPEDLLDSFYPNHTKKNRIPRKILFLLIKRNATSFQIAKCID